MTRSSRSLNVSMRTSRSYMRRPHSATIISSVALSVALCTAAPAAGTRWADHPPHIGEPLLHSISEKRAEGDAREKMFRYGLAAAVNLWDRYDDVGADVRVPGCTPANRRHRTWRCPYRMTLKNRGKVVYREHGIVRVTSGTARVSPAHQTTHAAVRFDQLSPI